MLLSAVFLNRFQLIFVTVSAILLLGGHGLNARPIPGSMYTGEIIPIGDFGIFEISGDARIEDSKPVRLFFRLWGVQISSTDLAEFAADRRLSCTEVGTVQSNEVGVLRVVECSSEDIASVSQVLISTGVATAICSELPIRGSECQ